jgi:hypothetical protein
MCWTNKSKPIEKLANNDIPVYKLVIDNGENSVLSYFYNDKNTPFKRGKVQKKVRIFPCYYLEGGYYEINEGYHSYSLNCKLEKILNNHDISISEQLWYVHKIDENKKEKYWLKDTDRIGKFIIPKGVIYYVNDDGDYVSEKIKLVDIINPFTESVEEINKFLKQ